MTTSVTVLNSDDDLKEKLRTAKASSSVLNSINIPLTTTTITTTSATITGTSMATTTSINSNNTNNTNNITNNFLYNNIIHSSSIEGSDNNIHNSGNSGNSGNISNFNRSQPSLMYVAASSLASVVNSQENISIVYEDFLESNNIINRASLLPTTVETPLSPLYGFGNNSLDTSVVLPSSSSSSSTTTIDFGLYNESAASEEWAHFFDLILSWQGICLIAVFCTFIVITIIGNTLVILAVITTRRLKTVTNCFVMSLAVADLLVGIFVMPPAVAVHLIGSWQLGWILCDLWVSLDVLLCTASILSLCAISVDRYLAVTQPLTYSRKRRSKRLALLMILVVWLLALAITCPPMLGWYEPGRRDLRECRYNQNEGYVIFSAMGSFFIPMAVMIYVYARISCVIASRHDNMTDISVHNKKLKRYTNADVENDIDHDYSEQDLSTGQKRQMAARTFSNQTIDKELKDIIRSDSDNYGVGGNGGGSGIDGSGSNKTTAHGSHCHSLHVLPSNVNPKNGSYELTRPSSLRRTPTTSSTMTTMTSAGGGGGGSGVGAASSLLETQWPPSGQRAHSFRHTHLSAHSAALSERSVQMRSHHHLHLLTTSTPGASTTSKSLSNRISSLKKENKTTQTLSIVVGGFIACWLPFFIYYLITPFLDEKQVSPTLSKVLTWLGWFNSAINPFIYAFYSVDFRAAFWRLTCKRFFSNTQKPHLQANTMSIRR